MSHTYETGYGDTLKFTRCDTGHAGLDRGHFLVRAATASGTQICVCLPLEDVAPLAQNMIAESLRDPGRETAEAVARADERRKCAAEIRASTRAMDRVLMPLVVAAALDAADVIDPDTGE
jgi:hypothetical protein